MAQLLIFLAIASAAGAGLALLAIHGQFAAGWLGAVALVGWAVAARQRWLRAESGPPADPSAPERVLWLRAAGLALMGAHLLTALLHPHLDLHVGSGNSLAIDSWSLTIGFLMAGAVFRRDARVKDERHDKIAARGFAGGYAALAAAIVALALFLGFAPPTWRADVDHFVLGNVLVALLVLSYLAAVTVQLWSYRPDMRVDA